MQETRSGAGLPSYRPTMASLAASGDTLRSEDPKATKKVLSIPDQGAATTMPRVRLENGGTLPRGIKW